MIKLIASDLDGSLLDSEKNLPTDFFLILKELNKRGIKFIASSGRSYVTLKKDFSPYTNDLAYICDNGSFAVMNEKIVIKNIIDKRYFKELIETLRCLQGVQLLFCGQKGTYHISYDETFNRQVDTYYINQVLVNSLYEIDDDIFKIAICDMKNPINNSYPVLKEKFEGKLNLQISGSVWMDVMNLNVNKGEALKVFQKKLKATRDETLTFGDFYNDIEMLQNSRYSFVMKNANADMRKYGEYIAPSNDNWGVIQVLKVLLNCGKKCDCDELFKQFKK